MNKELEKAILKYNKTVLKPTQQGGIMKKVAKKKTRPTISVRLHQKMAQEAILNLWGEVNTLKDQINEHKAKIHNLNGDTTTIFNKLVEKQPKRWFQW